MTMTDAIAGALAGLDDDGRDDIADIVADAERKLIALQRQERTVTAAGERPSGDGWKCIHSWANWEGHWWLWNRTTARETT